jgi:hypothetical protein
MMSDLKLQSQAGAGNHSSAKGWPRRLLSIRESSVGTPSFTKRSPFRHTDLAQSKHKAGQE